MPPHTRRAEQAGRNWRADQALDLQEDAARALADDLSAQIDVLQARLREPEAHLEHLAITRKAVTGLADRPCSRTVDRAREGTPGAT
jgi:hypothetical protein